MPVLVLQELQRPAVGGQALNGVGAVRQHDARRTAPTASLPSARRPRSGRRSTDSTAPSREPTNRGTAPAAVRRSASARSASPSTPSATRMATRRARTLPSPGRANSDSAGDFVTSGVTSVCSTFGIGAGICRMPRPGGHRLGQLRRDVHQPGHHALADRRRLHPRQLEAEGVDDVRLLDRRLAVPEQRRLRVVIGEALGLAADLVRLGLHALGKRHESRRARLERAAAAERVRLVGDPAAMDRLAVHAVALVVVDLRDRRVDRDLVEVRPAEPRDLRVDVRVDAAGQQRIVGEVDARARCARCRTRPARSRRRSCRGCGSAPACRPARPAPAPPGTIFVASRTSKVKPSACSSVKICRPSSYSG